VRFSHYRPHRDEASVSAFLEHTCPSGTEIPNWLRSRWEYMLYSIHGGSQERLASFGQWHAGDQLVGLAHFEGGPGEAYLQVHPDYAHLRSEMLAYAEQCLCRREADGQTLTLFANALDRELQELAQASGFVQTQHPPEVTSQYDIGEPFPEIALPEGFRFTDRSETNDLHQINRVLWRGFNHEGPPPEQYVAGRADVEKAPLYRPDLVVMVQAPDGNLVSYCGIWFIPANRLAHVEPVATDPVYRRQGLGRAAVLEAIRRARLLGATRAIVGSGLDFYTAIGFRRTGLSFQWLKATCT
jgi:predicted N-acetyltransferase YhbS